MMRMKRLLQGIRQNNDADIDMVALASVTAGTSEAVPILVPPLA